MLLSSKYGFLFVHIAKTGGTSVRSALEGRRWKDPWYWPMFLSNRFIHLSGHRIATKLPRHAKVVAAKEMLPKQFFDGLFKFAFVRNPWDLQVSSYHPFAVNGPDTSVETRPSMPSCAGSSTPSAPIDTMSTCPSSD